MRIPPLLIVAGTALAGIQPALAQQSFTLSKVTITGNKSVPTDQLMAVVKEHPGEKVTVADILADRDAISKVLESAHVTGSVNPKVATSGGKSEVIFAIDDEGVHAPDVIKVAAKLHQEVFVGNKLMSSDKLAAASGLTPGEELDTAKVQAAEAAIAAAYKNSPKPVKVGITGQNKKNPDGTYDIIWTIVETVKHRAATDYQDPQ